MADNVTITSGGNSTPPDGTIVATDQVGTSHYQLVKLVDGAADSSARIGGDASNGLDVDVTRIAAGASADIGAVADAAIVTDTTGSLSGKLRGLVKWAFERMPASLGQKAKTASFPVVIASDQDALAVTMAAVPTGGATAANQSTIIGHLDGVEGLLTTIDADTGALAGAVAGTEMQVDIVGALPAGTNNIGDIDVLTLPALPAGTNNIGDVDVLTLPAITGTVTANAGTGTFATKETRASTSAVTSVNDTASSTTLLAANANRLGATVYNDSTVDLYLKLGATASLTSFTLKMAAGSYYEVPFNYTGIIDGIWASDASGAARIVELTA